MSSGFHLDLPSGWAAVAGGVAVFVLLVAVNCLLRHGGPKNGDTE